MDNDSGEDGVQEAVDMLVVMGLACQLCDGKGYTNSPTLREDDYGREHEDYTCYQCHGTGRP